MGWFNHQLIFFLRISLDMIPLNKKSLGKFGGGLHQPVKLSNLVWNYPTSEIILRISIPHHFVSPTNLGHPRCEACNFQMLHQVSGLEFSGGKNGSAETKTNGGMFRGWMGKISKKKSRLVYRWYMSGDVFRGWWRNLFEKSFYDTLWFV